MANDDLNAPLGQRKKPKRKLPIAPPQLLAAVLGTSGLIIVLWATLGNDPLGGEPVAVVATGTKPAGAVKDDRDSDGTQHARHDGAAGSAADAKAKTAAATAEKAAVPPGAKTVTIIDGSSGKRQDVVIPGNPEQKKKTEADPRLLETSRHGNIPRIATSGERPSAVYAQPRKIPADKSGAPRIAIVVGGLGISASGTADAMAKLPASVTLAFAPYGTDLQAMATRARGEGHEVLLQAPMEPFDYPDNDPGPETLLTSLTPDQNIDRLHWLMSRFQGYVGIAGYMGAKFTASEQALGPVLRETSKRGLIFVDDGASPRSVASQIAGAANLPFAKTDVVIDAVPTATGIDQALAQLEMTARERGTAVGLATALPGTVTRIAEWAKKVEARGFVLVPITMMTVKEKSS